jgi:hypothetical protein
MDNLQKQSSVRTAIACFRGQIDAMNRLLRDDMAVSAQSTQTGPKSKLPAPVKSDLSHMAAVPQSGLLGATKLPRGQVSALVSSSSSAPSINTSCVQASSSSSDFQFGPIAYSALTPDSVASAVLQYVKSLQNASGTVNKKPPSCKKCGHFRNFGVFAYHHNQANLNDTSCSVPAQDMIAEHEQYIGWCVC